MSALGKYLRDNSISFEEFGKAIGKHKSTVSRIVAGEISIDRDTAESIFKATKGAITPNDIYGITHAAPQKRRARG